MEKEIKTLTTCEGTKIRRTSSGVRLNQEPDTVWLSEKEAIELRDFLNQLELPEKS